MHNYKNDVSVMLLFFNRPDTFQKVFDAVREAKPSRLFLVCDGARKERPLEEEAVKQCKEIASNIDWDCEVHQNYSDTNLGCGMRMNTGISWAFEYVEDLIIIEDDCVPSQSFFPFCKELLDKYRYDDRICVINGMNHLQIYEDCPYDYFFGPGCCWGWATWKRVWDKMDYYMNFLDEKYGIKCVEKLFPYYCNAISTGIERRNKLKNGEKLGAWTYQLGMACALENQIAIVPKYNLITNIGLENSTTKLSSEEKRLPKKIRQYYNIPNYTLSGELKHPKYVVEDRYYYELVTEKFKQTFFTKIEIRIRNIIYCKIKKSNTYRKITSLFKGNKK